MNGKANNNPQSQPHDIDEAIILLREAAIPFGLGDVAPYYLMTEHPYPDRPKGMQKSRYSKLILIYLRELENYRDQFRLGAEAILNRPIQEPE